MSYATKAALRRFLKGLLATVAAAAIAYGIDHVADLQGILSPVAVSLIAAALLALQKYLKEQGISMP
jgi:hypothetical protein